MATSRGTAVIVTLNPNAIACDRARRHKSSKFGASNALTVSRVKREVLWRGSVYEGKSQIP